MHLSQLEALVDQHRRRDYAPEWQDTAYGRVLSLARPGDVLAMLKDPRLVRTELVKLALGEGLLSSDGALWRERRTLIGRQFGSGHQELFARNTQLALSESFKNWEANSGPIDLSRELATLTMDVVCRTMFGQSVGAEGEELAEAVTRCVVGLGQMSDTLFDLPLVFEPGTMETLRASIQRLDQFCYARIASRRASFPSAPDSGPAEDLLTLLLSTSGLSDKDVRDEVVTMLLSGHETTGLSISWALSLLARAPGWLERLEAEVDAVCEADAPPGYVDLARLPLTAQIIAETLRLYPPVWFIARRATTDLELAGMHIPAGACVLASPYVVHRNAVHWPDPEAFRPERWAAENSMVVGSYLPFGWGRHLCLGQRAATVEANLILAAVVQRYRLKMTSSPVADGLLTLRHDQPLTAILERRARSSLDCGKGV